MHVAVTGGAGYIGSELVSQLLTSGYFVTIIDRLFFGKDVISDLFTSYGDRLRLVKKDIRDLVAHDLHGVDAVVDMASLSNDPAGDLDPDITFGINKLGRFNVATRAREAGVKRYVLASSCSVYGDSRGKVVDESSRVLPQSVYASANAEAEGLVLSLNSPEFCVTCLRQATVFGLSRRMRFDLVVNIMTKTAFETGTINVLGGGNQWRPLVDIRDTARAFVETLRADQSLVAGEIFNVGSDVNNLSVKSIAYIVRDSLPLACDVNVIPSDEDRRDYRVSFQKIGMSLGFFAKYSVGESVVDLYNALKLGAIQTDISTVTVKWYKQLIDMKRTLDELCIDGRLL